MTSYFDIVAKHADDDPDRLGVLTELDGCRTYGQLVDNAAALAYVLTTELGIETGSRIAIWAENRPEWIEAYLAASVAGFASVAANPEWTDSEVGFVLTHANAAAVVCDAELAERAMSLAATRPALQHVIAVGSTSATRGGALAYDELIGAAPAGPRKLLPEAEAPSSTLLMYTSGTTTGRPKAVQAASRMATMIDYREMFGLQRSDRALVVTPFFHGNGFGGISSALIYGASAVFPRRFSATRFWELADRFRPTYLFTLASIVNILMGRPASTRESTHAFRVLIVLGSAGAAEAIENRFGAPVIDWYGMTEAGMGTYTRLGEPRKPGSAGRPFPGSGMAILREDGVRAAPDEVGEVVFDRGQTGFDGYLEDAEATAAATDSQWFYTGDLGYFDEDGFFFFVDRKKDIVRRGGENISSMEVESVLRQHPGTADAAVVAAPDPVLGERPVAFVEATDSADPPKPEDLRNHAAGYLAQFKVPDEVFVVSELPRTATGKIEKVRLRARLPESGTE